LFLENPSRQTLIVGRLGSLEFPVGTYAYVGSAMGGLSKRVQHYLKPIRKPHWHIDTLIPHFRLRELWLFPSSRRQECEIARFLSQTPGIIPVEGFGSTDCKCSSHLFYLSNMKKAPLFKTVKGALDCSDAMTISIPEAP